MLIFLVFIVFCAFMVWLFEPGVTSLRDGVWYVYAVVTTIGFGDILAQTPIIRVLSILLSVYSHFALALITAVIINYFQEVAALRNEHTIEAFIAKLERLPELSKEELEELSEKVKWYSEKRK